MSLVPIWQASFSSVYFFGYSHPFFYFANAPERFVLRAASESDGFSQPYRLDRFLSRVQFSPAFPFSLQTPRHNLGVAVPNRAFFASPYKLCSFVALLGP